MTDTANLFNMARSKLSVSVGGRDNCSLHRWVLLKNSFLSSTSVPSSPTASNINTTDEDTDDTEEHDSFMFPDAGKLVGGSNANVNASEAQWLDSLLETLGDDDDDEFAAEPDPILSVTVDEDDDPFSISPIGSPLSASDELPQQSAYYANPVTVPYFYPYPVPYPPFHPPLIYPHEDESDSTFVASISSLPSPYDDPLPYYDASDSENLSVPEATEDTSDDGSSDAPPTPSLGLSSSSLSLDAASIPLPAEHSRLRHAILRVHVEPDDPYFYPFDPLPFPDDNLPYSNYQEC